MTHYLFRLLPFLSIIILRYPLAFLAVGYQKNNDVQFPFMWLGTIDNDLTGDSGWKTEHLWGTDPESYLNKVRWLWRNGGNRFNYFTIGVPANNRPSWSFWKHTNIPLFAGRFLDCRFGWSDYDLQGQHKYVITIRIKTKP